MEEGWQGSHFRGTFKPPSMGLTSPMNSILSSNPHGVSTIKQWPFVLFSLFFVLAVSLLWLRRHLRDISGEEIPKDAPARFGETLIGAPPVEYENESEQRNASLQRAWSTYLREGGHYMRSPFYKKVKCLLISWDKEHDDLHTEPEVCLARWVKRI